MDKIKTYGIGGKIIKLWHQGYSGDRIADMTHNIVTGRSVLRYLNKVGISTKDSRRVVNCEYCGKEFKKVRSSWRKSKHHFCSHECYWKHLKNPNYYRSAYHMRQSRDVVRSCGYVFGIGEVVHHIDGDNRNIEPSNLMVFASNGDHTRWHRMGEERSGVIPVWPPDKVKWVKGVLENVGIKKKDIHRTAADVDRKHVIGIMTDEDLKKNGVFIKPLKSSDVNNSGKKIAR